MKKRVFMLMLAVVLTVCLIPSTVFAADRVVDETCFVDNGVTYVFSDVNSPSYKTYRHTNKGWDSFMINNAGDGYSLNGHTKLIELTDGATLKNIKVSDMKSGNKKVTFLFGNLPDFDGFQVKVYEGKNSKTPVLIKNMKASSKKITFKEVETGKTYYARVRGWNKNSDNKKTYGKYSNVKAFCVE